MNTTVQRRLYTEPEANEALRMGKEYLQKNWRQLYTLYGIHPIFKDPYKPKSTLLFDENYINEFIRFRKIDSEKKSRGEL